MQKKEEKEKRTVLWSVWLTPSEDTATQNLINVLLKRGLIKNGPKGFVSRRLLLEYLLNVAWISFRNDIFNIQQEVLEQDVENPQIQ